MEIVNPADDSIVTSDVQVAGEEDIDLAVEAATKAFKGEWSKFTGAQRAKCMNKFADLLEENAGEIGKLETIAMGQPISISTQFAAMPASYWRYYAGWCDKLGGEMFPEDGDQSYKIVRYDPLGVCAGIAAWNASILFTSWKIAPAVATGNTFIFKTSEKTPLGALALGKFVKEAGVSLLSGFGYPAKTYSSHLG